MADRVSVSITLGGTMTAVCYAEFAELIAARSLSVEWDGEPFEPQHRSDGEPLRLFAHEVAWGRLDDVEGWCVANGAPFARWSGGYGGEWGAERVVFTGSGKPASFGADEDDCVYVDRETVERLGSIAALRAHFDAADFAIPPLVVTGDP